VRDSDDWWVFIDWQASLNKQAAAQGVLIYLQRALWLASVLNLSGCRTTAPVCSSCAAAQERLWDRAGFYVSGASARSHGLADLAGAGGSRHRRAASGDHAQPATPSARHRHEYPYLRHHYIAALLQCGLREEAIAEIKAYWGAMVDYGADTFWEIFDPADPDFSPYGSKLINSYCHAWSCTPAWFIRQYGL
jgi:hypothetical protein